MPKKKRTKTDREEVARKMLIETARAQAEHARRPGVEAKSFGDFLKQIAGQPSAEDVDVFNRGKDLHGGSRRGVNQGPPTPQYMQNSRGPRRDSMIQDIAQQMRDGGSSYLSAPEYQGGGTGIESPTQRRVRVMSGLDGYPQPRYTPTSRHQGGEVKSGQIPSPADIDGLRAALEVAIAQRNAALAGQQGVTSQQDEQAREAYRRAMRPTR